MQAGIAETLSLNPNQDTSYPARHGFCAFLEPLLVHLLVIDHVLFCRSLTISLRNKSLLLSCGFRVQPEP